LIQHDQFKDVGEFAILLYFWNYLAFLKFDHNHL